MRLVVSEMLSLDGVMEGPGPMDDFVLKGWTMPYFCPAFGKFKFDEIMASDAMLLGRRTYETFAAAWPNMSDPMGFADRMNGMPKHVVSSKKDPLEWKNSRVLSGSLENEVKKLKAEKGGDLLVAGSAHLVRALCELNLVDELRLMIYPVLLGQGMKLFEGGSKRFWKSGPSEFLESGIQVLRLVPGEEPKMPSSPFHPEK